MKSNFFKRSLSTFIFTFTLLFAGVCSAQIETTVEPFTGAKTYSSKYMFSDKQHSMHSITLVKIVTPAANNKTTSEVYFLLNFSLAQNVTLGDSMEIQVTPRHINSLPLTPYILKGIGYSSVPTFRTGFKELPEMTVVAIEKGESLLVQVNFRPKGHDLYTIPEETIKEWAEVLKIGEEAPIQEEKTSETK